MLDIAIIGAGAIADSVHMRSLASIADVRVKAVCDIDINKAKVFAARWGISLTYESHLSLLREQRLDAVLVLVWPDQTFRVAMDCLHHGIHCFVEKPAGVSLYQAESMQAAAAASGLLVQVGFNRRHIPLVRQVVEIMKKTTAIHQIEAVFYKNADASFYGGCADAFICDTIHALDLVAWLADSAPSRAFMLASRYNSDTENAWNALIRFQNGITGIVKANYQTGGRVHRLELHGPKASAFVDLGFGGESCSADILCAGAQGSFSLASAGPGEVQKQHIEGRAAAGSDEHHVYYGYYDEVRNFLDAAAGKGVLRSPIQDAVKTMSLAELLRKAAQ